MSANDVTTYELLLRALPATERWTMWAQEAAAELERSGLSRETIERRLFDGLHADASTADVVKLMRQRGYDACSVGTKAVVVGLTTGLERGVERACAAIARIRAEANTFGRNRADDMLRAAGWTTEDIADE